MSAAIVFKITLFFCFTAFIFQIAALAGWKDSDGLVYGTKTLNTKIGTLGGFTTVQSKFDKWMGFWQRCQKVSGTSPGPGYGEEVFDGCIAAGSSCKDIDQRIGLIQACGLLGVGFTFFSMIPLFLNGFFAPTYVKGIKLGFGLHFGAWLSSLIVWSVSYSLYYRGKDYCDSTAAILDVDDVYVGTATKLEVAAWVLITAQFILLIVAFVMVKPKSEEAPTSVDTGAPAATTEPTANNTTAA
eukprot:PhF_6_TR39013/c0_g1_i1/m.58388